MMEIRVETAALETVAKKMSELASEWQARNTNPPATVGGGKTVNQFEELAKIYKELNAGMVKLASNTSLFLTNVKNSFVDSDNKAAAKMRE